ncbi:hypothetical protein [Haloterrigena salifodinae]|uniref:hypothetical protein n=1 Tax=Haloterrigena salifodinae TaxID=2675099 RepID=UPI000F87F9FF|nr:hypothetical protein [Haloterrigena salifodinae]
MSDKRDYDPWDDRYDGRDNSKSEETTETADTSKMQQSTQTEESSENSKGEGGSETVRERRNVNMYLPDDLVDDLQLRYSELNVKWRREHGDDLPKNGEFYPAAIRAALNETSIEEELGLDDE